MHPAFLDFVQHSVGQSVGRSVQFGLGNVRRLEASSNRINQNDDMTAMPLSNTLISTSAQSSCYQTYSPTSIVVCTLNPKFKFKFTFTTIRYSPFLSASRLYTYGICHFELSICSSFPLVDAVVYQFRRFGRVVYSMMTRSGGRVFQG